MVDIPIEASLRSDIPLTVKVGDVVEEITSGDWGSDAPADHLVAARVIRGTDFSRAALGSWDDVPLRYVKRSTIEKRRLSPGDVLVEISGGSDDQPTGRAFLMQRPLPDDTAVIFSNFVKRIRVDEKRISPQFFALAWRHLYTTGRTRPFEKRTTGIRNFKLSDFLENECLTLPAKSRQAQIASLFEASNELSTSIDQVLAAMQAVRGASLQQLLSYGLARPSESSRTRVKQTVLGTIPSHWRVVKLGDFAKVSTGTTPSTEVAAYWDGLIPFVKTAEIANNLITSARFHVSDLAIKETHLKVHAPGTVFLAMYGQGKTRGQVGFLAIPAATSQNTAAIAANPGLSPKFLWFYLLSRYGELRAAGVQGHISHLNLGYVKELAIPLPPADEQAQIVAILEAVEEKIDAENARKQALERLIDRVLFEVMRSADVEELAL